MTTQPNNTAHQPENLATFLPTKGGNGYKLAVRGVWYYISKATFLDALRQGKSCVFRTIEDPRPTDRAVEAISLDA